MVVIVSGFTLFVTSHNDVIFTFATQDFGEVCGHNMHIILHALSLFVVVQQGFKHAGHMWPARVYCAARNVFLEFSNTVINFYVI